MSRSADRRPRSRADGGFTLIEVVVALGIITVVLTALLPQLLVGIRSTGTARLVTQAKGVAQGQLERMRNLPYHVAWDSGEYIDVLDYYFPDRKAPDTSPTCQVDGEYQPPQPGWSGYVAPGGVRCDYEPRTGAMYRKVIAPRDGFTVVVSTQFLSGATPPAVVDPPTAYNTRTSGTDTPAAMQIGVVVTVLYSDRQTLRPVSTYTRIADQPAAPKQIEVTADTTALALGSTTPDDGPISLEAGVLHLAGSLTYASTANTTLAATSAGVASGVPVSGAATTRAVPPTTAAGVALQPAGSLTGDCGLACWGATRLDLGPSTSQDGLPNLGSAASPMQALLTDRTNDGLAFDNGPAADRRPGLSLTGPLVRLDDTATAAPSGLTSGCGPGAGASSYVTASGFVRTTATKDATSPSVVEACALARASTISLFPTEFAPQGVVRVELEKAATRCVVTGVGHAPSVSFDYRAVVSHHVPGGPDSYRQVAVITPSAATDDPLAGVDLTADVGGGRTLGDYVDAWSSLQRAEVESSTAAGRAAVKLPGIVTMISQPVRTGTVPLDDDTGPLVDPTSSLSLTFGVAGCTAQDAR